MPLAAMVPLGIITVAIGLAGLGMGGVHYLFQGEVRDRFQGPGLVCPDSPAEQALLSTACTAGGFPLPPFPFSCPRRLATAALAAALPSLSSKLSPRVWHALPSMPCALTHAGVRGGAGEGAGGGGAGDSGGGGGEGGGGPGGGGWLTHVLLFWLPVP